MKDYKEALSRADAFDKKVEDDASKVSEDYAALVALSIRQAFAATEITILRSTDGSWNTDDILMFMKGALLIDFCRVYTNALLSRNF